MLSILDGRHFNRPQFRISEKQFGKPALHVYSAGRQSEGRELIVEASVAVSDPRSFS
jgi:hypothetical protein